MSFSPLFYAYKAENIPKAENITIRGTTDGQGKKWWDFAEGQSRKSNDSRWQQRVRAGQGLSCVWLPSRLLFQRAHASNQHPKKYLKNYCVNFTQ